MVTRTLLSVRAPAAPPLADNAAMSIKTLEERKAERRASTEAALSRLKEDLARYAGAHHGRFMLFGSMAKGTFHPESDVDIMLDFPKSEEDAAWTFVEDACRANHLQPDVKLLRHFDSRFLDRIQPHWETI